MSQGFGACCLGGHEAPELLHEDGTLPALTFSSTVQTILTVIDDIEAAFVVAAVGSGGPAGSPRDRVYPVTGTSTGLSGVKYPHISFTGTGQKSNSWCGEVRTNAICSAHPHEHSFRAIQGRTCRDLSCPDCWPYRAAELAEKASQRIWALHQIKREVKPRHVSFSMPPAQYPNPDQPLADIHKAVKLWGQKTGKQAGVTSATPISHLWRIRPEFKQWANDEASRINAENRAGRKQSRKENRYTVIMKCPNWREMLYYSPHVHMVAYGYLANSRDFYDQTGIVYTIHNKGRQLQTRGDVARVLFYLLSHASPTDDGSHILTYMGEISYNKMLCVEETDREEIEKCPDCGAYRVYEDTGEYVMRKITDRVYVLKSTGQRSQTTNIRGQDSLLLYLDGGPHAA